MGEALAVWKGEIARGQEVCAGLSLDDVGRIADGPMAGHADILRERIDGVIGA
jgi:hypothetical protein